MNCMYPTDEMRISQTGNAVQMGASCGPLGCYFLYQGLVVSDPKDPERKGRAAFNVCPSSDKYYELLSVDQLELKKDVEASLDGDSEFFQIVPSPPPPPTGVGNCSWKYKRVSKADPFQVSCAAITMAPGHTAGTIPHVRAAE